MKLPTDNEDLSEDIQLELKDDCGKCKKKVDAEGVANAYTSAMMGLGMQNEFSLRSTEKRKSVFSSKRNSSRSCLKLSRITPMCCYCGTELMNPLIEA